MLARRDRGLSAFHVREELALLSPAHAAWSQPLAMSVLRTDGRFRLSQTGAVGLSQAQLAETCGDATTKLPADLVAPSAWPCASQGDEE